MKKPLLFRLNTPKGKAALKRFRASHKKATVVDSYQSQLNELFDIEHPELSREPSHFKAHFKALIAKTPLKEQGTWAYFPWIHTLVHILNERDFVHVRSARNENIISRAEQQRLYESSVGIVGLSIGMSVAKTLALMSIARTIKLADFDTVDLSNLNRIPAGVDALGASKAEITARTIYLLNPYTDIRIFPKGVTASTIDSFASGLDIIVDEADSFDAKIMLRSCAKEKKIPLVSGADVGDRAVVGVERYDTDPSTKPFLGRIPADVPTAQLNKKTIGGLIARSIGLENHDTRMLRWPQMLGKKGGIVSFPQLGGTALLNGASVAYCVRAILLGLPVPSGQFTVALDRTFLEASHLDIDNKEHKVALGEFKDFFDL